APGDQNGSLSVYAVIIPNMYMNFTKPKIRPSQKKRPKNGQQTGKKCPAIKQSGCKYRKLCFIQQNKISKKFHFFSTC
ncbi:MAG: hypothetical protein CMH48_02465, partial [Muricauda sp.]|nr:hypothetical protein [Allomuricauda sp.]